MIKYEEIEHIRNAILRAGERILQYQDDQNYEIKFKGHNDPVTSADDEANQIIIKTLREIFPEDLIISEETYNSETKPNYDHLRKKSHRIWIIDPLDGTKDFIKGLPYFAVSVGFLLNDKPEIGFIYNPAKKFFMHGGINYGIYLNNKEFKKSSIISESLENLKICISTSEIKQNLFPELLQALPEDNIEFIGSVAYKLGLIASGEFDLILSKREKSDWDIAAGIALLQNQDYDILDQHFIPITLNKKSILTDGLIVGSKSAVRLYRDFLNRL